MEYEERVITPKVSNVECGIVRPEIFCAVMCLSKRSAATPEHDSRTFCKRRVVKSILTGRTHHGNITVSAVAPSEVVTTLQGYEVTEFVCDPIFRNHAHLSQLVALS